jgi:hypothetical protein
MAELRLYRTYRFLDKDPVIDELRTLVADEALMKRLDLVHQISGVATTTLDNWFNGDTVSPQNRTIMAVATSLGYQRRWVKEDQHWSLDSELKKATAWDRRQNSKPATTNGKRHNPKRKVL